MEGLSFRTEKCSRGRLKRTWCRDRDIFTGEVDRWCTEFGDKTICNNW